MILPPLPLLHEGDSYLISLADEGKTLRLTSLSRFENNQNSDPMEVKFFDLDERGRATVMQQINRRYPGRVVKI